MLPQKIHIIPEIQEFAPTANKPLLFWKKIKKKQEKELHLIMLFEGRTAKEGHDLGKELWEIISAYENELTLNQNGLTNPEYVCEAILKISNDFLVKWSHGIQISNWSELGVIIAVANSSAVYFTRIGKPRIMLFRNNQIILADENLTQPRSPQFFPPFSELAGGALMPNDRILVLSGDFTESFSLEEISSLIASPEISQVYYNVVRSLEVLSQPKNTAFLLGDLVPFNKDDNSVLSIISEKLKENRIGELYFQEFNPASSLAGPVHSVSSSFVPWKEIAGALGSKLKGTTSVILKIISLPLKPLLKKFNTLSFARKTTLVSSLVLFIALIVILARSMISQPSQPAGPQVDYKALYDRATQLKEDAQSALIYQDEEKARKNLGEADGLLEQAALSSEWGIKALKLRQEVDDQLAALDKAQTSQAIKIWTNPEADNPIKKISLENNKDVLILASKNTWTINPSAENSDAQKISGNLSLSQSKGWLVASKNEFLYASPQDRSFYAISPASKNISEKKDMPQEVKASSSAMASYDAFVYFFDPEEVQIKQFVYGENGMVFKSNWLKQDLKSDLKDDPIVSMAIEGSIFSVTRNGNFYRFSGGKKVAWDAEKPGTVIKGDNLAIFTRPEDSNVYLLDPSNKRIVILEKETGKLKGQIQNSSLAQALDFQVNEKGKTAYFVTDSNLFKLSFAP